MKARQLLAFATIMLIPSVAHATDPASLKPGLFSSAQTNFEFALTRVCLPYVAGGHDDVVQSQWGVAATGWGPQAAFHAENIPAHLVGTAGRVNVGVKTGATGRTCLIEAVQGDPDTYRDDLLAVLRAQPQTVRESVNPPPPRAYAHRDMFCAKGAPAFELLASTADRASPGARILVTVTSEAPLNAQCQGAN